MAETTLPRTSIKYDWDVGENFKTGMDGNLLLLEILTGLAVIDRDLTAPPGGESAGDIYIPATASTGAWASQDGNIAYYDGASWVFVTPWVGLRAYIIDEDVQSTYKGAGWSAGIAC